MTFLSGGACPRSASPGFSLSPGASFFVFCFFSFFGGGGGCLRVPSSLCGFIEPSRG